MSPQDKWFGILYIAWAALMLISVPFQHEPVARRSHLLGAAGFAILLGNLFIAAGPFHLIVSVLADAILAYAAVTYFKARSRSQG